MENKWEIPSRAELAADGCIHILGLCFGFAAAIGLLCLPLPTITRPAIIGLILYVLGLHSMLGASALYNLARNSTRRPIFRRLDHGAIFLMIAGTYSPFCLIAFHGRFALCLFIFIWLTAFAGIALKVFCHGKLERATVPLYLLMGWCGLAGFHRLVVEIPHQSLILLGLGGLLYSVGVIFHLARRLRFHNAVWHGFVLAAAVTHYASIICLLLNT